MRKLTRSSLDLLAISLPVLDEEEQRAVLGGNSGSNTGSYTGGGTDSGIMPTGGYNTMPTGDYSVPPTGGYDEPTGGYGDPTGCICPDPTGYYINQVTGIYDEVIEGSGEWVPAEILECDGSCAIIAEDSSLTNAQKGLVAKAVNEFIATTGAEKLYDSLVESGVEITFKIDNTMENPASYDTVKEMITFQSESVINYNTISEEITHAFQNHNVKDYGNYEKMSDAGKNFEFEAKLFKQLSAPGNIPDLSFTDPVVKEDYKNWLYDIQDGKTIITKDRFNYFCSEWDGGDYNKLESRYDFNPKLLIDYYELPEE